jgi:hypothetical protein
MLQLCVGAATNVLVVLLLLLLLQIPLVSPCIVHKLNNMEHFAIRSCCNLCGYIMSHTAQRDPAYIKWEAGPIFKGRYDKNDWLNGVYSAATAVQPPTVQAPTHNVF